MIAFHSKTLKVSAAEYQASKIGINSLEERLCRCETQVGTRNVGVSAIAVDSNLFAGENEGSKTLGRLNPYIIVQDSLAGTSKRLDSEYFSFLHFVLVVVFDERNLLPAMDIVSENIMARDVPDRFDRNGLSGQIDFVALHHFLDGGTNVTYSGIDTSMLL